MYKLNLFRHKVNRLCDVMPFGRITHITVADKRVAVLLGKDGSLQATGR